MKIKLSALNQAQQVLKSLASNVLKAPVAIKINRIIREIKFHTDPYMDVVTQLSKDYNESSQKIREENGGELKGREFKYPTPEALERAETSITLRGIEYQKTMEEAGSQEVEFELVSEKLSVEKDCAAENMKEKHTFDFGKMEPIYEFFSW